jgi:prepilin-type N-terminal cleavage/methylation domain-containing protein
LDRASQPERIDPAPLSAAAERERQFTGFECDSLFYRPEGGTKAGCGRWGARAGFSLIEILVVMLIMAIITMIALPSALNSLKGYRLHSDATAIASYLNVARMKAASQFAPYRLVVYPNTVPSSYVMERLCGSTPATAPGDPSMNPSFDANCTGPYQPFTTAQLEGGTQYASSGNTFSACRPTLITGSQYPGTITGATPCSDPLYIYFNTRGSPVNGTGNPMSNGGTVLYIQSQNKLVDAVTVSIGGRVATYMWGGTGWGLR